MAKSVQVFLSENGPLQDHSNHPCTVIASTETTAQEFIQLSLQQFQVYEDTSFYELREQFTTEPSNPGRVLSKDERPVTIQNKWQERKWRGDMRLCLRRRSEAATMARLLRSLSPDVEHHLTDDMCNLTELSESAMLKTLRTRFEHSKIYTYVGSILIAVNPYFFYPIYNPTYIQEYQSVKLGELPPHIFAIADDTYNSMLSDKQDQSVIISGESGAGKTESTKFLLHHILNLSAKFEEGSTLEMITLGTGPVLEAFGNALTLSNNNSSRFGKFILVRFRENGAYYNASIQQYLLEKSRIVLQAERERNYHIFYYLLAGASPSLRRQLSLQRVEDYRYLSQGMVPLEDVCELDEFHRLSRSLAMLGLEEELQNSIFSILAAILHLGNIEFLKLETVEGDNCHIKKPENLALVSKLLKVDESTLKQALVTRKSWAGGNEFVVAYKCEQATYTRDAMAKALYGALFDWIVEQVNVALGGGRSRHRHRGNTIGVLDIFGFEVYEQNSFEQFCINYANEQLQQYFNKHVFKSEQEEYMREGIVWDAVSFTDNSVCLELIAKKPTGLLYLLDEECSFPGANDNSLFLKFEQQHKKHSHFKSPHVKQSEPLFIIVHYAGDVLYQVKGFREKNIDLMRKDIVDVLKTSKQNLVRALIGLPSVATARWTRVRTVILAAAIFKEGGRLRRKRSSKSNSLTRTKTGTLNGMEFKLSGSHVKATKKTAAPSKSKHEMSPVHGDRTLRRRLAYSPAKARKSKSGTLAAGRKKGPAPTVSAQFQHSLLSLMDMLEQTKPYFVRCIKSNATKTPCNFDNSVVLRQLRYTGMLQTIRIRKSGYSVRMPFEEFYEKYHFLMGPREADLPSQIKRFLEGWDISVSTNEAQIGKTKVFMHEDHAQLLQQRLQEEVLDRIIMIQKWTRGNLARMRFLNMRRSALILQCCIRGWISRLRYHDLRRQVSAAVVIQARWRCVTCRRSYLALRKMAVVTQAWWRGKEARQRYAEMVREQQERMASEFFPRVARSNTLSDFTLPLKDNLYSDIPPDEEPPMKIERSFSEDPALLPPSPLRRQKAQKDRLHNSPKRLAMQIMHTRSSLPSEQKSLEHTNSLPTPRSGDEVKRPPHSPQPVSRSSYYPEAPLLSPHNARSTTLPGVMASHQPPAKSPSKKKSPGRRSSRPKNTVRWTAKGDLLTHYFHTHLFKTGQVCTVCNKAFTGFLKQGLKCEVCQTYSHHHCVSRVSVCPRVVQEGRRLTVSKRKVITCVEDLDEFDQFLLEKVGVLQGSDDGGVGEAFKVAMTQFHTSIIASLSLQIQPSVEAEGPSDADAQPSANETGHDAVSATFEQLVVQFTHIIKNVSKTYSLHESHRQVVILQLKGFLDEFCNTKGSKKRNIKRRYSQVPAIRTKTDPQKNKSSPSKMKVVQEHKGHQFVTQKFNVVTVCELCDKQIAVLTTGMVCSVCTYTCHETCYKKVNRKCKPRHSDQLKTIDEEQAMRAQTVKQKTQFGVSVKKLVPGRVVRVPVVLERLIQHVETCGLLTQGIYRKNPSPSNKLALKEALDKDPLGTPIEEYHIHAAASLIKTFLHELPHPLFTFELYREFMLCTELSDPAQKLHTIHQLISQLPVLSHCILERLVFHLARVAQNENTNLMSPENLAIIFAPSLFRPKKSPKPQDLVKELAKAQNVLLVVISDQLERLNSNLQSLVLVSTAAASTANQLHELIERESKEPTPEAAATCRSPTPGSSSETTVEQLAVELECLERERAELTAQLPKLEPFKSFPSSEDLTLSYSDEDRSLTPTSSSSFDSSLMSTVSQTSPRHKPPSPPVKTKQ